MNTRIPLIAIALCALAPALAAAAEHREQSDQTLDLAGITALRVENARGEVDVRPGPAGSLHVSALKVARSTGARRARELAAETEVLTERLGGTLELRVRYSQHGAVRIGWRELFSGGFDAPSAHVRLSLQIPSGMSLEVKSASGDISTVDLTGPLTLESSSGDVTVIASRGPVAVTTSSGDVEGRDLRTIEARSGTGSLRFENVSGPLEARTTGGSIVVRGAADSITVRSVSGDIDVDAAPRGVVATSTGGSIDARGIARFARLSAANGDIDFELVRPIERIEVTTVTGHVSGRLANDVACRLELRTSSGEMEVLIPMELKSVSRREVVGVVGGGKAPVVLQTSAGDIELMSGGE